GRSTALKAFADMGFYVVDNLPMHFLQAFSYENNESLSHSPFALGIDSRTIGFSSHLLQEVIDRLKAKEGFDVRLLYLDCDNDVLVRRFTETRRRHPLASDRPVIDGIIQERALLAPLKDQADLVIDTSALLAVDLKEKLRQFGTLVLGSSLAITKMSIHLTSFSYRHGLPRDADLVWDLRFLRNPHYQESIRHLSGQTQMVQAYIQADPLYEQFFQSLKTQLLILLPAFEHEGKSYLNIALGCTGGKHRSVFMAEALANWLLSQGYQPTIKHRDLG
nr:RNase adapter RapZ [Alphaproteobacteria bacterium]